MSIKLNGTNGYVRMQENGDDHSSDKASLSSPPKVSTAQRIVGKLNGLQQLGLPKKTAPRKQLEGVESMAKKSYELLAIGPLHIDRTVTTVKMPATHGNTGKKLKHYETSMRLGVFGKTLAQKSLSQSVELREREGQTTFEKIRAKLSGSTDRE